MVDRPQAVEEDRVPSRARAKALLREAGAMAVVSLDRVEWDR